MLIIYSGLHLDQDKSWSKASHTDATRTSIPLPTLLHLKLIMALNNIRLPLLLFLIPPSTGMTEYAGDNMTVAATSVQPCHLFGDSDLYGAGVRASFYISWVAGLIGSLLGAVQEMKSLRLSFNILLLALLIILLHDTCRGSFALLEWYIVTGLAGMPLAALLGQLIQAFFVYLIDKDENSSQCEELPLQDQLPSVDEHATSNIDPRSTRQTKRECLEEQRQKDAKERVNKPHWSLYYSDPLGLGFLCLLYGILACSLPWLYFVKLRSGHKEGCHAPIVLFGTWDIYNKHWLIFLKVSGVWGALCGILCIPLGLYLMFHGAMMQRTYTMTLNQMRERKYSDIKLLRSVENLKRALSDEGSGTETEAQTRERSGASQHLARAIQRAGGKEEVPPNEGHQLLVLRASVLQDKYRRHEITVAVVRGSNFVTSAVFGGLMIWFIERTIEKNHIDMDDEVGSSSGQLLALLVAILTTANFLWEVCKFEVEKREARKEADEIADHIYQTGSTRCCQDGEKKAFWRTIADNRSSFWQDAAPILPPVLRPTDMQPGRRGSMLGVFVNGQENDNSNDMV